MKVQKKSRDKIVKRVDLSESIPLSQPLVVTIDICSYCNIKCIFCLMSYYKKNDPLFIDFAPPEMMSIDMFKKIIDDLKSFPQKVKQLRLYNHGEPLLNPNVVDMVAYASRAEVAEQIVITTNGLLLNPEMSEALISAGVTEINVSINGINDEQYTVLTKTKVNFQKFYENLIYLYSIKQNCTIRLKTFNELFKNNAEKEKFIQFFGPISDSLSFDFFLFFHQKYDNNKVAPGSVDIMLNASRFGEGITLTNKKELCQNSLINIFDREKPTENKGKIVCPQIFYSLIINSTGEVSICCSDTEHALVCGDVSKDSVKDIWNSKERENYLILHLKGKKDILTQCADCNGMKYFFIDNIDDNRDVLLQRIQDCGSNK